MGAVLKLKDILLLAISLIKDIIAQQIALTG